MIKRYYNSYNETIIIVMIIIILRNLYLSLNQKITMIINSSSGIFDYIETFYALLLIFYNIILLISNNFKDKTKYKLRKYFILTNLIVLFLYICKEPLFFYSEKKLILVLNFILIEFFLTFFVHKIKFTFRGWLKLADEIFVIALISAIFYFLQYLIMFIIGFLLLYTFGILFLSFI